jgi:hypothetical protein
MYKVTSLVTYILLNNNFIVEDQEGIGDRKKYVMRS